MAFDGSVAGQCDEAFDNALYANDLKDYTFDLQALRKWMIAFVVCDFNIDVGVEIEYMFPSTELSPADVQTICFSSFPEKSNPDRLEDSVFHFKFRHTSPEVEHTPNENDPAHWYGYCLFRQKRDVSAKRNFRQKSLILLSQHEFPPLFSHIVKTVSMLEWTVSPALIESACSNIAAWGPPEIGIKELPFLGEILEVHMYVLPWLRLWDLEKTMCGSHEISQLLTPLLSRPPHNCFPLQGLISRSPSELDLRVEYTEIHTSEPTGSWARLAHLLTSLSELYVIFERALLSEPLVILADDPACASEFVSSIVDLIRPVPFGGCCRPYLTMQSVQLPLRHYLIGITNPFFLKRILSSPGNENCTPPHVVYLAGPETRKKPPSIFYTAFIERAIDPVTQSIANEPRGYIAKDPTFLRKLEAMLSDPESSPQETNRYIRRHFALLSALFLAPLNRYLTTLTSAAPDTNIIDMGSFSEEDFIESLNQYGCSVHFKGKTSYNRHRTAESFYRKFIRSPGFFTWLEMKMRLQTDSLSLKFASTSYVSN
ncbi:hypothetical protein BZA77DRAFT_334723 [Pyronema omphalodes]|nr:hypothetical protein BZA77DRAFT_334723 [Pyronema omphalodes]